VVQWAKPKCQVSLADPQLEGKEDEEEVPTGYEYVGIYIFPLTPFVKTLKCIMFWCLVTKEVAGSKG